MHLTNCWFLPLQPGRASVSDVKALCLFRIDKLCAAAEQCELWVAPATDWENTKMAATERNQCLDKWSVVTICEHNRQDLDLGFYTNLHCAVCVRKMCEIWRVSGVEHCAGLPGTGAGDQQGHITHFFPSLGNYKSDGCSNLYIFFTAKFFAFFSGYSINEFQEVKLLYRFYITFYFLSQFSTLNIWDMTVHSMFVKMSNEAFNIHQDLRVFKIVSRIINFGNKARVAKLTSKFMELKNKTNLTKIAIDKTLNSVAKTSLVSPMSFKTHELFKMSVIGIFA